MPFDFMRIGVKKNLCRLLFVTAVTLIQNPFRIKTLFNIISEKIPGQVKNKLRDNGQFMSFGVLKEYRMIKDGETNLTIPHAMMRKVFEHFKEKNKNSFFLLVLESNERAIRFYHKYNCLVLDEHFGESKIIKFETDNAG
jgi:ribosomal protein S18 acetylase RimI-like enzyme